MKNKIWNLTALFLIGFTLTGCDPTIGYQYYLDNKSDSVLIVYSKAYEYKMALEDTIREVQPGSEILIYETQMYGRNPHDEGNEFLEFFDKIAIMTESHIPIRTDIYKRENWKYDNDVNGLFVNAGTNIYRLELTNDSIKK